MTSDFYLKYKDEVLAPEVATKLWPFLNAHRPHDEVQTWRELRASGLEKVEEESVMDVVIDQYEYELL